MGDDGADVVMFLAFFARVFFGLAIVSLALALILAGAATLHPKVYAERGTAPHLVTLACTCVCHGPAPAGAWGWGGGFIAITVVAIPASSLFQQKLVVACRRGSSHSRSLMTSRHIKVPVMGRPFYPHVPAPVCVFQLFFTTGRTPFVCSWLCRGCHLVRAGRVRPLQGLGWLHPIHQAWCV